MTLPALLQGRLALPVVAAPMFLISNPALVIEQCKAGVVGAFPSLNARPGPVLEEWLQRITSELADWSDGDSGRKAAPFAVNLIVHKSNERLDHDLALCVKYKVPIVITSLGARDDVNQAIHSYGGLVFHDVINNKFAKKAIEKGADGLVAVAAGAGGHAGSLSPFAFIQEIREWFDGPLLLSGCIATGDAVLAAQAIGADLAYVGSAFIATTESGAAEDYKQAVVNGTAADIVYTSYFTGVHGNYLKPSIEAAGLDPAQLPEADPSKMSFDSSGSMSVKAWRDIWGCGQGIGAVKTILPAKALIGQLKQEYAAARQRVIESVTLLK